MKPINNNVLFFEQFNQLETSLIKKRTHSFNSHKVESKPQQPLPEIVFITSYPPRECGIATYSQDLIKSLNDKFENSFTISICALESDHEKHIYKDKIKYTLNTDDVNDFSRIAKTINSDSKIQIVLIQHEFGFFVNNEKEFKNFLNLISKPKIIVFHTILPKPNSSLKINIQEIANAVDSIIVMTNTSAKILIDDYFISKEKITVIPHGTHLVAHSNKNLLKENYSFANKKILSTFGLLSSGKNIETTLNAMPAIVKENPDVLFLIIGKTHPTVVNQEGECYRNKLADLVVTLKLEGHVKFINQFLPLNELLDYLQLTDIYLFTSKDPNQAVSGTFSYAISCGCAIISTPIPHAKEVLKDDTGTIIDFENSDQLAHAVNNLLSNGQLRENAGLNGLHRMASTAWENAAIAHALLFESMSAGKLTLHYKIPPNNLNHIKKLTTDFGIIQFSKINHPDLDSGYTLDDNARALIVMCQYYELTKEKEALSYMYTYFNFIKFCLQSEGYFLNYVNGQKQFTAQNETTNLADSTGRAIWALGYLNSMQEILPTELIVQSKLVLNRALLYVNKIHSTRAMAFVIKGVYYFNTHSKTSQNVDLIKLLANRLVEMYKHEAEENWQWHESYLTYANSILPEAMLCAWLVTGDPTYKQIAKSSFDFLLSKTFKENQITVISNKGWLYKNEETLKMDSGGEQPIDVAYTIMALSKFYDEFKNSEYQHKMKIAFDWFLGRNNLKQIMYNPCTGGCYDGLEKDNVNLNQGAESTISYLMAKLTIEKSFRNDNQKDKKEKSKNRSIKEKQFL